MAELRAEHITAAEQSLVAFFAVNHRPNEGMPVEDNGEAWAALYESLGLDGRALEAMLLAASRGRPLGAFFAGVLLALRARQFADDEEAAASS